MSETILSQACTGRLRTDRQVIEFAIARRSVQTENERGKAEACGGKTVQTKSVKKLPKRKMFCS